MTNSEYKEPKIQEEIKNCKVDDKVMVSNDGEFWDKRYFSMYDEQNDKVYAYGIGLTSWTTNISYEWKYARLPRKDEL